MQEYSTESLDWSKLQCPTRWVYNGMDSVVTLSVYNALRGQSNAEEVHRTYTFVRNKQRPALFMMRKGIRIDHEKRGEAMIALVEDLERVKSIFDKICVGAFGHEINYNSPDQLKKLFYEYLCVPTMFKFVKGQKKVSTDRDTLEKIGRDYVYARPFVKIILRCRDLNKLYSTLNKNQESDGRFRCSYNVVGTETGRWASRASVFNTGTNAQNITKKLREIFVPDPGKIMCYADLEQAESRAVAYLSGDEAYIHACESGDLHTTVAKMVWPELEWTGDLGQDRALAELRYYRDKSRRDLCKVFGHGSNYDGKPPTLARITKVAIKTVEEFQERYFTAFPGVADRIENVIDRLQENDGVLTTPLGRRRRFLGRLDDPATHREAVAYDPQSMVGDILNSGMEQIYDELYGNVDLLAQIHDATLSQFLKAEAEYWQGEVKRCMTIPVNVHGRTMIIPASAKVGPNWMAVS